MIMRDRIKGRKLGLKSFPESRNLTKDDYVIICGDFITIHGKRKARIYH